MSYTNVRNSETTIMKRNKSIKTILKLKKYVIIFAATCPIRLANSYQNSIFRVVKIAYFSSFSCSFSLSLSSVSSSGSKSIKSLSTRILYHETIFLISDT